MHCVLPADGGCRGKRRGCFALLEGPGIHPPLTRRALYRAFLDRGGGQGRLWRPACPKIVLFSVPGGGARYSLGRTPQNSCMRLRVRAPSLVWRALDCADAPKAIGSRPAPFNRATMLE